MSSESDFKMFKWVPNGTYDYSDFLTRYVIVDQSRGPGRSFGPIETTMGFVSRYPTKAGKEIMKSWWRLWAKALGEKSGNTDAEANLVAVIRTCIVLCYIVTNCFIAAGVIRHW